MSTEYQRINLEDYTRTGEGATAVAYTHKTEPRLAKLYNKGFEADEALRDFRIARTVFDMGLPSPEPYRLVTDWDRSWPFRLWCSRMGYRATLGFHQQA